MKKTVLFLLSLFVLIPSVFAQGYHWTLSHGNDEGAADNTFVVAKLNLGTTSSSTDWTKYEVAAFIGNEVRAVVMGSDDVMPDNVGTFDYNFFMINVQGNYNNQHNADNGKTIIFKMFNHSTGIEYDLKSSVNAVFGGENTYGSPNNLVELSAVEVTAINLKDIEMAVGATVDAADYLTISPSNATKPNNIQWSVGNFAQQLTLNGSRITANDAGVFEVMVMIGEFSGTTTPLQAQAKVTVTVPTVRATAIRIKDGYDPIVVNKGNSEYLNFMLSTAYELVPFDAEEVVRWVVTGPSGIVTESVLAGQWYPAEKGETKMQAQILDDNGGVRLKSEEITVRVTVEVEGLTATLTPAPLVLGIDGVLTLKPNDGATVNAPSLRIVEGGASSDMPWNLLRIGTATTKSDGSLTIPITPLYPGKSKLYLTYDGVDNIEPVSFEVGVPLTMKKGWQWVTLWSYIDKDKYSAALGRNVDEIRSQADLLAYDATYGFYGDLHLTPYDGLKLKATNDVNAANAYLMTGGSPNINGSEVELNKAWTWISNPYVHSLSLNTLNLTAANGDRIVSKESGFAEYSGGRWTGTLTTLKPFESYLYYNNRDAVTILNWPDEPSLLTSGSRAYSNYPPASDEHSSTFNKSYWNYDASRFMDNMSIVASMDISDKQDYTVGAFVGDECRGEGAFIDGLLFITVHANKGETVSFLIKDIVSDKAYTIAESMPVSTMTGSISSPVPLTISTWASGIQDIGNEGLKADDSVYDLNGRLINVRPGSVTARSPKSIVILRKADGSVRKVKQ